MHRGLHGLQLAICHLHAACFEFPHTVHMAVAAVALVVFVVLATAFTTAEIDMNPASRNLLGMSHSK